MPSEYEIYRSYAGLNRPQSKLDYFLQGVGKLQGIAESNKRLELQERRLDQQEKRLEQDDKRADERLELSKTQEERMREQYDYNKQKNIEDRKFSKQSQAWNSISSFAGQLPEGQRYNFMMKQAGNIMDDDFMQSQGIYDKMEAFKEAEEDGVAMNDMYFNMRNEDSADKIEQFLNMDVIQGNLSWAGISTYLTNISKDFKKKLKINKYNSINFLELNKKQANNFFGTVNKKNILKKIKKYTGNFLSLNELKKLDRGNLVFFGNHIYNHYNVINLNYKELKKQYLTNQNKIRKYKNYTKFFAYPFGQKETCYNLKTNKILFKLGASAIFSSNPLNFNTNNNFFHRIPMAPRFNNNNTLISHLVLIRFKQLFYWNVF